jgi:hypothetical protein
MVWVRYQGSVQPFKNVFTNVSRRNLFRVSTSEGLSAFPPSVVWVLTSSSIRLPLVVVPGMLVGGGVDGGFFPGGTEGPGVWAGTVVSGGGVVV